MDKIIDAETHALIISGSQVTIWDTTDQEATENTIANPFAMSLEEQALRRKIARHKAWLASFPHECPSPYKHYRIGVYIRYFNQTKYKNYLDYHKQQYIDTIDMCPNWRLVDFYVDVGQTAPNMENAKDWCRLIEDCFAGEVDLIITQKTTNVSRDKKDLTFISRILATQPHPIGIYFISEDLFTLASYYKADLREKGFLPPGWESLPENELKMYPAFALPTGEEQDEEE